MNKNPHLIRLTMYSG